MKKADGRVGNEPANKIIWLRQDVQLLKDNFGTMSLRQLAELVRRPLGTVRHKLNRLGLKRNQKHYSWTVRQTNFLLRKYKTCGNVEIAEVLNKRWPRARPWTLKHVQKKMDNMGIKRTPEEVEAILLKNRREKRYNLTAALEKNRKIREALPDDYILANCLRISKENREQVKKEHGKLIEFTRNRILQKRQSRRGGADL